MGGADRSGQLSRREIIDLYNNLHIVDFDNVLDDDKVRVYAELETEGKDVNDVEEWKLKLDTLLSTRAVKSLRESETPAPFIDQIHHMLNLYSTINNISLIINIQYYIPLCIVLLLESYCCLLAILLIVIINHLLPMIVQGIT